MKKIKFHSLNILLLIFVFNLQSCKFIYHCPTYEAHYDLYRYEAAARKKSTSSKSISKKKKKTKGKAEFPE